jgi:hypothetical protein
VYTLAPMGSLPYHGSMSSVWWLRWVVVAIAALIGVVLVGSGHLLIGVLVMALAASRVALLFAIRRRRAAFRAARSDRSAPPS